MAALKHFANFLTRCDRRGLLVFGVLGLVTFENPILGILIFLLAGILLEARENYGVLEKCGIPVIKPTLFLGSEPNFHKTVLHLADIERFNQYGGIWGSYVGRSPQIYVADPELIKLITVKDFAHFSDRQDIDFGSPIMNELLDYLPGEKWKQVRTNLSPMFTTAKLNKMSSVIAESSLEFVNELRSGCGINGRLKFDCGKQLSTWLIGMFAKTTLGIQLEDSKNPDNKFAQALRDSLGEHQEQTWLFTLSLSFPFLAKLAPAFDPSPAKFLEGTFRQVIESCKQVRRKNTKDFTDTLCDLWERVSSKEFQDLGITENTILSQVLVFFFGGFDTTNTTLSHLLLYMAENPDVQDKMHEELMQVLAKTEDNTSDRKSSLEINHDIVEDSKIPYILACINEALRLAPPVYRPERICTKDWSHNEISIKKGTIVMLSAWAANRNPKVFPDEPNKFKPERFLPEAKSTLHPYALTTFGFGPRNCIGMRFAYENMKLFVCHFVRNFRVEKRADTHLRYKTGNLVMVAFGPLYLDLVLRE